MKKHCQVFLYPLVIIGFWMFLGCHSKKKTTSANGEKVLAKAGDQVLYLSEIAEMIPKAISSADSLAFVKRYANTWVRKRLLMDRATAETQEDAGEIEKKVADYRQYLVLQAFEEQYVSKNVDTNVTAKEIADYYRTNLENFALQQPIARAWLVAIPKNTPNLARARSWIQSGSARDQKELQSFCYRFANFYHLNDSTWVLFDELVRNTPFREADKGRYLKNNRFSETSDQQNVYLLTVKECKLPPQPAPLAFIKPQIQDIVLNRRKVKLIQELEKRVYEDGEKKQLFEIVVN